MSSGFLAVTIFVSLHVIFPHVHQMRDIWPDPANISKFNSDLELVTNAGRNYLAGEYDWYALLLRNCVADLPHANATGLVL